MYLDPGFGSMIIQMIVAGIAAAAAFIFIARKKISGFFRKDKNSGTESTSINDGNEAESQLQNISGESESSFIDKGKQDD